MAIAFKVRLFLFYLLDVFVIGNNNVSNFGIKDVNNLTILRINLSHSFEE